MNNRKNCRFYACQSRELLVCLPGIAGGGSLRGLPQGSAPSLRWTGGGGVLRAQGPAKPTQGRGPFAPAPGLWARGAPPAPHGPLEFLWANPSIRHPFPP